MIITLVDDTDLSVLGNGQQARTYQLFSRVAKQAEIRLVTQRVKYREKLSWVSQIVIVRQLPYRLSTWLGGIDSLQKIFTVARDSDFIVVEHIYGVNRWALIASKLLNIPIIYDTHGNEIETCNNMRCRALILPFERYMYRSVDTVIAISEPVWNEAARMYNIYEKKHLILLPGLREIKCKGSMFREKIKAWGVGKNEILAITHGSQDYGPNLEALRYLINSTKETRRNYGVVFVVAGPSNKLRPGWLSDSVLYVGLVDDLDDFLCSADVAISLNVSGTGIHMKVLDYISAGLPLVTTYKSLEGLPLQALKRYPLRVVRPFKDDIGKTTAELVKWHRGPFSGSAALPTWDEQAEKLIKFLSNL